MKITKESIAKAEQVLIDNGIEADEAKTVLEAVGYTLMDVSLYDTGLASCSRKNELVNSPICIDSSL